LDIDIGIGGLIENNKIIKLDGRRQLVPQKYHI